MPWEPEDQLALRAQTGPSGGLQPIPKQRVDEFVGLFESQTAACRSTLPHSAVAFGTVLSVAVSLASALEPTAVGDASLGFALPAFLRCSR